MSRTRRYKQGDPLFGKQLLFYTDSYVLVSKQTQKINSINELSGMTLGVFQEDASNVSYYLWKISVGKFYGKFCFLQPRV